MLVRRGLTTVLSDLAEMGYDARWTILGADDVGAPHIRKRIWILATNAKRQRLRDESGRRGGQERQGAPEFADNGEQGMLAYAPIVGWDARRESDAEKEQGRGQSHRGGECADVPNTQGEQVGSTGQPRECKCMGDATRITEREQADEANTITACGESRSVSVCPSWWAVEPDVGRVVDGVPRRMDRLRAIGNAQVPAVAALAWRILHE